MKSCAITDKGIVRKQNQDAYYASCDDGRGCAVLLVCDGMGGARAGNVASELATQVFSDEVNRGLEDAMREGTLCTLMKAALRTANSAVYELSRSDEDCAGMGTTVVAAVVIGDEATVLNVGDSRAYHISGGRITQITRDHSVVEDMIRRGDITREQSMTHPNKNLITRAVGTVSRVEADLFSVRLRDGDYLLLCSDGLSNLVSDEEMLYEVTNCGHVERSCEKLLRLSISRGAPDNVTVVLFQK